MNIDTLVLKFRAEVCDPCKALEHATWLRTEAVPVDISKEESLARNLSYIMQDYMKKYDWKAVSSNNVFWRETEKPIRILLLRKKGENVTLVNPEIKTKSQKTTLWLDGCGSIGEANVFVRRANFVDIEAYVLEKGTLETIRFENTAAYFSLHELDHLEGIVLTDYGHVVALSPRTQNQNIILFNILSGFYRDLLKQEGKEIILDKGTTYLILKNKKTKLYWQATTEKKEITEVSEYGQPIYLAFPNLPGVEDFLQTLPLKNYTSYNNLLKLPVKGLN